MTDTSYPEFTEAVERDVVEWAVDLVDSVAAALMPDGRPFGMVQKSQDEQLSEYMVIRDDPAAWQDKIRGWVAHTMETARAIGVEEGDMASVHPYDIAEAFAFQYAAKMESLRERKLVAAPMGDNPLIPTGPSEMTGVGAWQAKM